jgi:hypothetical protein
VPLLLLRSPREHRSAISSGTYVDSITSAAPVRILKVARGFRRAPAPARIMVNMLTDTVAAGSWLLLPALVATCIVFVYLQTQHYKVQTSCVCANTTVAC